MNLYAFIFYSLSSIYLYCVCLLSVYSCYIMLSQDQIITLA